MRKKLLLGVLLFLVSGVAAFPASMEVLDRKASVEDPGRFAVTVKNDFAENRSFRVNVNPFSSWFFVPETEELGPGENHTFVLEVTPKETTIQQNYEFKVFAKTGSDRREFTDYFTVERKNDLSIRSVSSNTDTLEPGEKVVYSLEVLNTAPSEVENYSVRVSMRDKKVESKGIPLTPGATGTVKVGLETAEDERPGTPEVLIELVRDGEVKQSLQREVEVLKERKISRSSRKDNRIIVFSRELSANNQGNYRTEVEVNTTIPTYLDPITTTTREADTVEETENGKLYSWSFDLEPGEAESVSYTVNYWIPAALIPLMLFGFLAVRRIGTEVVFTKTAIQDEDGLRIHIELENKSSRSMKDVEVEDFVPDVASVDEDFPMAKPVMRKTSDGTRLNWEIDELEAGDQRVFEYSIEPLFQVEGGVTLPAAEMEAGDRKVAETGKVQAEFQPGDT